MLYDISVVNKEISFLVRYAWCIVRIGFLQTKKQSDTAIFLCQLLSNLYQPIQIFRYDQTLKTLYIQAGRADEIAVIINQDGNWNFVL
ncbi:hypothetical protein [Nostoc sp. TCL26-01]|uniref:DUF6888 family protein n=1 Tax=Nostoc sp. TCL26-01 TaxID=2576904 RepID=UPI002118BBAF|nr:hypothetical protein [Nostoc sp. TCL26-01]